MSGRSIHVKSAHRNDEKTRAVRELGHIQPGKLLSKKNNLMQGHLTMEMPSSAHTTRVTAVLTKKGEFFWWKKKKEGKLPRHVAGVIIIYEVKVQTTGHGGASFEIICRNGKVLMFEAKSFQKAALWRAAILDANNKSLRAMTKEADELWEISGAERGIPNEKWPAAFAAFCRSKNITPATRDVDTILKLINSVPTTDSEGHTHEVVLSQLHSFCSAFGRLSDCVNVNIDKVAEWYVGTLQPHDMIQPFPAPVAAHSFFIYLHIVDGFSADLRVVHTDLLLHTLETDIVLEPAGKTVHLEGHGSCFDSIYGLLVGNHKTYYPCANYVRTQREKKGRIN